MKRDYSTIIICTVLGIVLILSCIDLLYLGLIKHTTNDIASVIVWCSMELLLAVALLWVAYTQLRGNKSYCSDEERQYEIDMGL